jgi:hypothetical protein
MFDDSSRTCRKSWIVEAKLHSERGIRVAMPSNREVFVVSSARSPAEPDDAARS